MDKKEEALLESKKQIKHRMMALADELDECMQQGLLDENSTLYNEIISLKEEIAVIQDVKELEEVLFKAKEIERNLDAWLAVKGKSSFRSSWPDLERFL